MMISKRHALLLVFIGFAAMHSFAVVKPKADTLGVFRDSTFSLNEVVATAQRNQTPHQTMPREQLRPRQHPIHDSRNSSQQLPQSFSSRFLS